MFVISIIKNHPNKLPFELLNIIEPCYWNQFLIMDGSIIKHDGILVKFFQNLHGILIESHWNYQGVQM